MEGFPSEIVLGIAECLDSKSLLNLMLANKQLHALISNHERSISTNIVSNFVIPPIGTVLSSEMFMRRPVTEGTFQMAAEIAKRDTHTEGVLNSDFVKRSMPARFESSSAEQKQVLHALLKKAILQCNHIADIAVKSPCRPMNEMCYNWMKGKFFEPRDLPLGYRLMDPCTNMGARASQREYLTTLAKEEIAMIYFLVTTLSWGFFLDNFDLAHADTNFPERQVVFKECVLRHGSWFAWSHILGDGAWKSMADKVQKIGWTELVSFELGDEDTPPSLHSTLVERFNELYMSDPSAWDGTTNGQVNVLSQVVYDLVTGDEKEEKPAEKSAEEIAEEVVMELLEAAVEEAGE
ncbi:uncharacterized protein F4807DRAFT_439378 [Annulohypoxylon truncatum]|uniref:uncharacterized protein n=1 Tax=Annulohypoxylon truncatum TaxID=327061 RepID=UPI0020087FA8|nr:uncharacterized protein F4807DRAFT_439378 [Annulohypoxylon truncatum]KAI1206507.1 hypothetical protein F4807DRAFT_439378 [Annulohypoxylon truncatum]